MENNKYYTPELSEFRIGLEYKFLLAHDYSNYKHNNSAWSEMSIESFEDLIFLSQFTTECLKECTIVKYLDKSDIESFGFIHDRNYMFNFGQYRLHFIQQDNELDIIHIFDNESDDDTIFLGNIKNKSELKVLLKQLQICQ